MVWEYRRNNLLLEACPIFTLCLCKPHPPCPPITALERVLVLKLVSCGEMSRFSSHRLRISWLDVQAGASSDLFECISNAVNPARDGERGGGICRRLVHGGRSPGVVLRQVYGRQKSLYPAFFCVVFVPILYYVATYGTTSKQQDEKNSSKRSMASTLCVCEGEPLGQLVACSLVLLDLSCRVTRKRKSSLVRRKVVRVLRYQARST